ncbi:sodium/proline symporter [candidate division KSB1 bacterium]|nr:sodium/proline symporter [candidate division KSB1 bacterium]
MDSQTVIAISFIVYSLFIVGVGLYTTKLKKKSSDDFVLAGRELGPWTSSLSASASAESGWVMLGLVGMAFSSGLSTLWIVPGIGIGYLFNWFVLADKLRKSTLECDAVTLPQYISSRFERSGSKLKVIAAIIITAAMLGYVAAQMNAAGKAFQATFDLDYHWGVLAGALIILAYTITGGFRAICWTDVIQASFMAVALVGMPLYLLSELGGCAAIASKLVETDPNLLTLSGANSGSALLGFVVGMLGIGLGYPGQPHILSRFMATKDEETVKKGGVIAFIWFVLVYLGAISFGLIARSYFGALADAEQALPLAVNEFLPPILGGFVIAAIVAAICSTADSQLMVVTSTISRDILPMFKKSDDESFEKTQNRDRIVLIILAVISVLFALSENRVIFTFVLYAWSVLGASFGPLIIFSLLWKKTTRQGAMAGMITGAVVSVVWKETHALSSIVYELVPAFVLAGLAIWVVSLLTQKIPE